MSSSYRVPPSWEFKTFKGIYVAATGTYYLCDFYKAALSEEAIYYPVIIEWAEHKISACFLPDSTGMGYTTTHPLVDAFLQGSISALIAGFARLPEQRYK